MFYLKMGFILFISINLYAISVKEDEDISSILFNESKNFSNLQKGNDLIYGSLDFNLLASDALYELSLKENVALTDKIYLLKEAININNFKAVTLKEVYTYYFSLLLRQNENKNMYEEIITLYRNLNEELQIDKDLICMRLEASGRLESFGDDFKKFYLRLFLYMVMIFIFKWFLKEDRFFLASLILLDQKKIFSLQPKTLIIYLEIQILIMTILFLCFLFLRAKLKNIMEFTVFIF